MNPCYPCEVAARGCGLVLATGALLFVAAYYEVKMWYEETNFYPRLF